MVITLMAFAPTQPSQSTSCQFSFTNLSGDVKRVHTGRVRWCRRFPSVPASGRSDKPEFRSTRHIAPTVQIGAWHRMLLIALALCKHGRKSYRRHRPSLFLCKLCRHFKAIRSAPCAPAAATVVTVHVHRELTVLQSKHKQTESRCSRLAVVKVAGAVEAGVAWASPKARGDSVVVWRETIRTPTFQL